MVDLITLINDEDRLMRESRRRKKDKGKAKDNRQGRDRRTTTRNRADVDFQYSQLCLPRRSGINKQKKTVPPATDDSNVLLNGSAALTNKPCESSPTSPSPS